MPAKISYLSVGSETVAMNDAMSIYSASLTGAVFYGTPRFLYLNYSFYMSSSLKSSGRFSRNAGSSPNSSLLTAATGYT
jgi:hypothetical protein